MSVHPTTKENQIRKERRRAYTASLETSQRNSVIQNMFEEIDLGSSFEIPAALPRLNSVELPRVAIFQNSDILDPVVSWQHTLAQGIAPLADTTGTGRTSRICLINAASGGSPGSGWMDSKKFQEDAICRRSTLYDALMNPCEGETRSSFYPLENGGIYSPNIIIHRGGPANNYTMYETRAECTVISVVSVSRQENPRLRPDGSYCFPEERAAQREKMVTALRIAAKNGHRNIVIGSFGSVNREVPEYSSRREKRGGGIGGEGPVSDERLDVNPIKEVSELWASLLDRDEEFLGYFDKVVFIVGVGVKCTEEYDALQTAFNLSAVPRCLKSWFPGECDFAYRN